ncbi:hypothetical protein H6F88_09750 [Oculatella sp. FACHB-28]|uniref:hypothetical protein n=1 Tax=Oculatella sp. FACHB-28 TaxID=2692845 RepID=UPI001688D5A5|nr:hypothetical protein [Oculatella sp. FACHB-28]MBD1866462.1 hypothetical protein [Cyanobacteria bacterium FACHB-471]MBD2056298.1 hypothetical protein [Oculatella sp. FACHB-28]
MQDRPLIVSSVSLPVQIPEFLPKLRSPLGQNVGWSCVPSRDFARILGIIFAGEGSVRATGYHYAIA